MASGSVADTAIEHATTVLVVDDEPDMRFLARTVLEQAGIIVAAEAGDGQQALATLRDLNPPPIPTVVLLDNQMPGLPGIEVAAQIRTEMPTCLIVLFSAYLTDDIEARADQLGIPCVSKDQALQLDRIVLDLVARQ